jgi:hypothetical protein
MITGSPSRSSSFPSRDVGDSLMLACHGPIPCGWGSLNISLKNGDANDKIDLNTRKSMLSDDRMMMSASESSNGDFAVVVAGLLWRIVMENGADCYTDRQDGRPISQKR